MTTDYDSQKRYPVDFTKGGVRLELAGMFRNQHGDTFRGYAVSDGWRSHATNQEQFIVYAYSENGASGPAMGRFGHDELMPYITE